MLSCLQWLITCGPAGGQGNYLCIIVTFGANARCVCDETYWLAKQRARADTKDGENFIGEKAF